MKPVHKIAALAAATLTGAALFMSHVPKGPTGPQGPQDRVGSPETRPGVSAVSFPVLPDPRLTPGATLPVTARDVCVRGYSKKVRNVPESEKQAVYREYGILSHKPGEYEVDHLISLELGGSNAQANLWIEAYDLNAGGLQMGAHEKDKAENATHAAVCAGKITLQEAQKQIAADWTVLYRRFVSPTFPKYVPAH